MFPDSLTWGKVITSVSVGTGLSLLVGNPSPLMLAMFILLFIDTLTGLAKGLYQKKFQSHLMRKGISKFIGYCVSIIVAHQFSLIPILFWVEPSILAWLALVELTSIIENMRAMGYNLPDVNGLFNLWKKLRDNKEEVVAVNEQKNEDHGD